MQMERQRQEIVACGKKMLAAGFVTATGGNLSICDRAAGLVAITPTGIPYDATTPADIVILDMDARVVQGPRAPSSELALHCGLYRTRGDISAVVHTHSVYATTISCLRCSIPPVHYLVGFAGMDVPCAQYATFGTQHLADNVCAAMHERRAVLLANHGLLAAGDTLQDAYTLAELVEFCAEVYYRSRSIGTPVVLDEAEMQTVREKFANYGKQ